MSWQWVSFLIVAAVLVAGFAWYERSRPASQVVALVAALAALAIAGRIAFAAFPNVKPTTDIVIFAGYALGPAPGFAVGALSGLVSNFYFGQGPWTPWQMAGWGLCGILGAGLALWPRPIGRFTLAAVCGVAALGYGALQNFSLMATYGGDLSWRHFWVLEGRAVPFEIAHAAGNVALALVAGPAMIRMLVRFRRRFEWRRGEVPAPAQPPAGGPGAGGSAPSDGPAPGDAPVEPLGAPRPALRTGAVLAVLAAVLLAGAFFSTRARADAGNTALGAVWLVRQQNDDGGWGISPGRSSGQDMTGWAMLGLEAAGTNPLDVSRNGHTGVDYLRNEIASVSTSGDLARTILALEGAGVDPREFGGVNLVSRLLAKRRADGSYQGWPPSTAYAVIALRAAGIADVSASLDWLREVQNEDGGWGDTPSTPSNADTTGAVLQAVSPTSKASDRGVGFLNQNQQKGGGWRLGGNGALNTQSTAWAAEGLLAAGANASEFKRGGANPFDYLAANQESDGHYRYSKSSDQSAIWVTSTDLVAAAEQHLPLPDPARIPAPKTPASQPPSSDSVGGAPIPTQPLPESEPAPESGAITPPLPEASASGGISPSAGDAGSHRERFATPGKKAPGASADKPHPGGRESGGTPHPQPSETPVPDEPASGEPSSTSPTEAPEPAESSEDTPVAGSILTGALAGCLLFGIGWAGRTVYMRRRYGL